LDRENIGLGDSGTGRVLIIGVGAFESQGCCRIGEEERGIFYSNSRKRIGTKKIDKLDLKKRA
jgi:hypothetical protein